ncbi:MAG: hypothetical protein ACO1OG_08340 [Devosia sp.]
MQATSEIGKLKREIAVLADIVKRPRPALTAQEKRALKSEIDACIQELDEMRARLSA